MAGMDTTLLALSGIGLKYNKVIPIFWQKCAESFQGFSMLCWQFAVQLNRVDGLFLAVA
jgi:hypothetical protein